MDERIKYLRKSKGLSQDAFAALIGITQPSVSSIESGKSEPANSTIASICKEFGCDEKWLRTGAGDPYPLKTEDDELQKLFGKVNRGDDPLKAKFLKLLLEITEEAWPLIEKHLKELKEAEDSNSGKPNN